MKILFILLSLILSSCASNFKMPQGLPEPISEEIEIYSIAAHIDFARNLYQDIKKEDLEEIGDSYLLDTGKVKASSNIVNLVNSGFGNPDSFTLCFIPRHRLVYQSKLGKVEVDICFRCGKTRVTIDDWSRLFDHEKSVEDELNKIFSAAGLRLPVKE